MYCRKFVISGSVQGVGFRLSTKRFADKLKICGHAKNIHDGTVEVLACGDTWSLGELEKWFIEGGPAPASVRNVDSEEVKVNKLPVNFDIR